MKRVLRIPAYLLVPAGRGPFPGVVALHDRGQYYDVPHEFNREMQEDAFRWLEQWLK